MAAPQKPLAAAPWISSAPSPSDGSTHARDLDELRLLKDKLADHVEEFAEALLGPPTKRNAGEMRYGRKGSLCVYATGKNGPSFHSFEEDVGGSLLDLIVFVKNCSFDEVSTPERKCIGAPE